MSLGRLNLVSLGKWLRRWEILEVKLLGDVLDKFRQVSCYDLLSVALFGEE